MPAPRPLIVIPGDDPIQIRNSPHLARLAPYGEVVLYADRPGDDAEKVRRARDATCLINSRSSVMWPAHVLRQLPRLRMFAICGIGTDAIDLEVARELGIDVRNLPGRTAPIVAEHALGLLLAVSKRAWFQTNELKQGRWTGMQNIYLRGKTLGLVGAGPIAAELARLARAIGMQVQAWTFHPTTERARELGVEFVEFDELLSSSDAISLHVKLTAETRGLIGPRELELVKPGALLVNTARGAIVDTQALVEALHSGRLAGAGLDVFDQEPLPAKHPLLDCQQVVLSPHNADQTPEGMELLNSGIVENVIAFFLTLSDCRCVVS
ncbi:MAG TPA: NAD(P)-dependent oxidoreductase [Pirellulales bacterium]|nr:NAD(P)-dependent oxidoreductase [Pirellulales bacterium]